MKKTVLFFVLISLIFLPLQNLLAAFSPSDTYYQNQWYLTRVRAGEIWNKVNSSPDVIVAVIDSGTQITHPDLQGNIWTNTKENPNNDIDDDRNGFVDDYHGWDFVAGSSDPSPKPGIDYTSTGLDHGTMVAGIIGASGNNNQGVAGLTWNVQIMPLRALNSRGEGRVSDVVRAIDYAINNGADIINLSFVGPSYSESLRLALIRAYQKGVIVVAAAGNDDETGNGTNLNEKPLYPACYVGDNGEDLVMAVAATDAVDQKAPFSSYGSNCVDISAPGISFFSTVYYNPYLPNAEFNNYYDGYWSGTSMATAVVSGSLALVKAANPHLTRYDLVNVLLKSSDNIDALNPKYVKQLGSGRINVGSAVNWALDRLQDYQAKVLTSPYALNTLASFNRFDSHNNKIYLSERDGSSTSTLVTMTSKERGDLNFLSGDVNYDRQGELVVANSYGSEPRIRVFNNQGQKLSEFLAFDRGFRGGVSIALADINNDNKLEIIAAPEFSGAPQIKIFNWQGKLLTSFWADKKTVYQGFNISAGDINNDRSMEIVLAPVVGGAPEIKIFNTAGKKLGSFFVFDKKFKGGVKVAVDNFSALSNHGADEIAVAPMSQMIPQIKIFSDKGKLQKSFLAYNDNFLNGLNLASGDINNDGRAELITGVGPGGAPHVRIFNYNGDLLESFYAFKESFDKGVKVGFMFMGD